MARPDFARYDAVHAWLWAARDQENGPLPPHTPTTAATTTTTTSSPPPAGNSPPSIPVLGLPGDVRMSVLEPQARLTFFAAASRPPAFQNEHVLESEFVLFAEHEPRPPPPSPPLLVKSLADPGALPLLYRSHHLVDGCLPRPVLLPPIESFALPSAYNSLAFASCKPFGSAPLWLDPYASSSTCGPPAVSGLVNLVPVPLSSDGPTLLSAPTLPPMPAYPSSDKDDRWLPPPARRQPTHDMCLPTIKPSPLNPSPAAGSALQTPSGRHIKPDPLWPPPSPAFSEALAEPPPGVLLAADEGDWPFPPLPTETCWPTPTSEVDVSENMLGLTLGRPKMELKPQTHVAFGPPPPGDGTDLMAQVLDAGIEDQPESRSSSLSSDLLPTSVQRDVFDSAAINGAGAPSSSTSQESGDGHAQATDSYRLVRALETGPRRWSWSRLGSTGDPIATDRPTSALRLDTASDSSTPAVAQRSLRRTSLSRSLSTSPAENVAAWIVRAGLFTPPRRRPPSDKPMRSRSSDRTESDILASSPVIETNAVAGPSVAGPSARPNWASKRVKLDDEEPLTASLSPSPRSARPKRPKPVVKPAPRRSTLSAPAVEAFTAWYESHKSNPYPTADEKSEWVKTFDMTRTQVDDWFINKRRRAKVSAVNARASGGGGGDGGASASEGSRRCLRLR